MTTLSSIPAAPTQDSEQDLRIIRVLRPEPCLRPGTYEVRLRLSRRLTPFEHRALRPHLHRMHVIGTELVLLDTTLERVADRATELAELVREVESRGRALEREAEKKAEEFAASRHAEESRLAGLADAIEFP